MDRTHNERIKGYELGYSVHSHPSGRWRFDFSLGTLDAALYTVKVAFKIRGSSAEVRTMEKDFEVEPADGWVPPAKEHRSPPIILTPDTTQLQVLIDAQDDESSDVEDITESVLDAPPLALVSNSEPESFPSDERLDDQSESQQSRSCGARQTHSRTSPKKSRACYPARFPEVEPSSYENHRILFPFKTSMI